MRALALTLMLGSAACASDGALAPRTTAPSLSPWIGTWAAAPQPPIKNEPARYGGETLRLIVHTSAGGSRARVRISNVFGDELLHVGAAHVGRRTRGADVDPPSDRALSFEGRPAVDVPAHGAVTSDGVDLDVAPLSDLAVSLFLPRPTRATTTHVLAQQTSYVSPKGGDATGAAAFPVARTIDDWPFLTGVDVAAAPGAFAVVAFGDSTVDGDGSTPDANHRFPDYLATHLANTGVLNEGLIGNRLLHGSPEGPENPLGAVFGPSALARFDRDVLGQAGVKVVIVRTGTNDIGFPGSFAPMTERVDALALERGYRELVARARQRGLRALGTTLSPFEGTTLHPAYFTEEKERVRQEVNAWVRESGTFDGVIDFDRALADPAHPARLRPAFDSGDHIHPNDAGYAAVAEEAARAGLR